MQIQTVSSLSSCLPWRSCIHQARTMISPALSLIVAQEKSLLSGLISAWRGRCCLCLISESSKYDAMKCYCLKFRCISFDFDSFPGT